MSKIVKTTFALMIAMMVAKILGFGRELVLASAYGTSMFSDAYITAMNIPNVIFAIIGTSIGTVLIPMYIEVNKELGKQKSLQFINNVLNITIIICFVLSLLGIIFAEQIVKIFAIGFEGEVLKIAINFTRITIVSIVFTGLSYIMTAYLQIKNNFTIPGLISVPKNIIIIVSILLSLKYGPYTMIIGTLIGISSEFFFQLPFAVKEEYKYKFYVDIKDKYIKKMIWLTGPILIGVAVNQVNTLVDRTLASRLVEGSISALNYANKLNSFVTGLFITPITSVVYPMLSQLSTGHNKSRFIDSVTTSINSIVLLVTPISIGAIVLSRPIIRILFERGAFDDRATYMTSIALVMYAIGMLAFGLTDILGKVFYSIKDTKTPMINSAISMLINIILNLILIKYLQLAGLALSTSLSAIVCILLLFISLKNKIGYFGEDKIIKTTCKAIFSSLVMGITTYYSYNILSNLLESSVIYELISLACAVFIGIVTYTILIIILNVEEVNLTIRKFKKIRLKSVNE